MSDRIILKGKNYYLQTLVKSEVTQKYVDWLNNPEINKFLEVRFIESNLSSTMEFVSKFNNKDSYIFGIYDSTSKDHIGNMALYLDLNHRIAYFGFFIGEKNYWGRKASLESCFLIFHFAFDHLEMRKVGGVVYSNNIGSIFNYKQLGFVEEGRLKNHFLFDDEPVDILYYSMMKEDWKVAKIKIADKINISMGEVKIIE